MNKFITAIMILLLALCGCGCNSASSTSSENNSVQTREFFAMDTFMSIKAYGDNSASVLEKAEAEIKRLEKLLSVTDSESDIYKINLNSGTSVQVSDDTLQLIEKANAVSKKTNGATDISIYPVLREWGFTTGEYNVPDKSRLEELLVNVDYTKIQIDNNMVTIPKDYAVDLGSIAKGYAGDKIMELLKENGVDSALVNLGGNVQTLGLKPDGSKWSIAIKNPTDQQGDICIVQVEDKAVVTSGSYERYFTADDGNKYWHILDPKTGKPADKGLVSVTIIGDSGTLCDSLSTSLFVMGKDGAINYAKQNSDIEVLLVTDDMEIFITEGIEESVKMLSNYSYSLIRRS